MGDLRGKDGAAAWARNLLSQLRQIQGIRFVVVTSGASSICAGNERVALECKFEHVSIPLREDGSVSGSLAKLRDIRDAYGELCYHAWERVIQTRSYVEEEFKKIVESIRPDLVMINDIWAALHLPAMFDMQPRKCLILLNDEVALHKEWLSYLAPDLKLYGRIKWLAQYRFRKKVEGVIRKCHAIITLTRNDIPKVRPADQLAAVLPPLLSEPSKTWTYVKSRSLLFVGHIEHFSNRYAIEWICTKFMPAMYELDQDIKVSIVGAVWDRVPVRWRAPNVIFLGDVGRDGIISHLLTDDLFIAPISTPFGAKLKLAECAAFGMPFVATEAAMSGLPFLSRVPRIELEAPENAAVMVRQCIEQGERLTELSAYISRETRKAQHEQSSEWREFVWKAVAGAGDAGRVLN